MWTLASKKSVSFKDTQYISYIWTRNVKLLLLKDLLSNSGVHDEADRIMNYYGPYELTHKFN